MSLGFVFSLFILLFLNIINFNNRNIASIFIFLELTLIFFIILIFYDKCYIEACIKYFIVQSIGSLIIIFFFIVLNNFYYLLFFGLLIKLGVWPFHIWLINSCFKFNLFSLYLLFTLQKLIPLYILSNFLFNINTRIIFFILVINIFFSIFFCYNQINIFIILTCLSIIQQSWIISSLIIEFILGWFYFLIYFLICSLFFIFCYFNQFLSLINESYNNFFFIVNCLLIAGIPPTRGFFNKILVFYYIINYGFVIYGFIFFFFSSVSYFFYINIISPLLIRNFNNRLLLYKKKENFYLYKINLIIHFFCPFFLLMFYLFF